MRFLCRPLLDKMSRRLLPQLDGAALIGKPATSLATAPVISQREKKVAELSDEVFSKGNVHLKNVNTLSALPEGLHSFPEVCFIGKPNVGKSSIISCLLHNRRLGRSGGTRGTTRLLQFFNVGDAILLVDTPGYGGWKGRQLSQNLAERASAFAILFRYLALRRQGPLKRVYWVMEANGHIQPRDEEIFAFLQEEQIPFTILLNKIDRFNGDRRALQMQMDNIWNFLGSDQVPVLGVRANPIFPERCLNIRALQHDITYYCTQEITRAEDLTYKGIRELSYAPPTAEYITAVERRYPLESFVVPQVDNLSLERFVLMHEEAKAKWLENSNRAALLSAKDRFLNHLVRCCDGEEKDINYTSVTPSKACLPDGGLMAQGISVSTPPSIETPSSSEEVKVTRKFRVRASLRAEEEDQPKEDVCRSRPVTSVPRASLTSFSSRMDEKPSQCLPFENDNSLGSFCTPQVLSFPLAVENEVHTVRAINGVRIPKSMLSTSLAQLSTKQEGSLEHFAQRSGSGAYDRLLADEVSGEQRAFLEEGEYGGLSEGETLSLRRPLRKSARRRKLDRILEKYVSRVRKQRSLYMQAEGYMCPWLSGAGQPFRTAVVGLASDNSSMGQGGNMMRGLKRTGFGGKSFSAYTMKNRGRATKKTGSWAT